MHKTRCVTYVDDELGAVLVFLRQDDIVVPQRGEHPCAVPGEAKEVGREPAHAPGEGILTFWLALEAV